MKLTFSGFEWDDGNRRHCQKHGLSQQQIEHFLQQDNLLVASDVLHAREEERFLAIGRARMGKPMPGSLHTQEGRRERADSSHQCPVHA